MRALTLRSPERQVAGFERMSRIYEAIKVNNPEQAKEAVRQHLTEAASLAESILTAEDE